MRRNSRAGFFAAHICVVLPSVFFAPFDFAKEGKTENKTAASRLGIATSMMVGRVRDLSSEVRTFAAPISRWGENQQDIGSEITENSLGRLIPRDLCWELRATEVDFQSLLRSISEAKNWSGPG